MRVLISLFRKTRFLAFLLLVSRHLTMNIRKWIRGFKSMNRHYTTLIFYTRYYSKKEVSTFNTRVE